MNSTQVSDLTVEELFNLIRAAVREALEEKAQIAAHAPPDQRGILDIPPLSVGSWPEGLRLISREEYYEDDAP